MLFSQMFSKNVRKNNNLIFAQNSTQKSDLYFTDNNTEFKFEHITVYYISLRRSGGVPSRI